jgi:hypothetical protein
MRKEKEKTVRWFPICTGDEADQVEAWSGAHQLDVACIDIYHIYVYIYIYIYR